MRAEPCRHLILILGDQLDDWSSAFDGFDAAQDRVLMVEAMEESTHVWSHKIRTTLFLSAMRHFAERLRQRNWQVDYRSLDRDGDATLAEGLCAALEKCRPQRVIGVEPGDLRVRQQLEDAINSIAVYAQKTGTKTLNPHKTVLEWREDKHFLCSLPQFRKWAGKSTSLRMEFFYRVLRKQYKVLMDGDEPVGGQWNFDSDNRKSFGKAGPQNLPQAVRYAPDQITQEVMALVNARFAEHPGSLENFNWPVTREQALAALKSFIDDRLPQFGPHEDAMWTDLDFGWLERRHVQKVHSAHELAPAQHLANKALHAGKRQVALEISLLGGLDDF